jgi:H2-forming N5,N10-methylenetetrahydromethanopterin dehydrogenase-like enzyme
MEEKERYIIQKDDLEIEPDAIVDTETNTMYECRSMDMDDLCKLLNDYETRIQDLEQEQIKEMQEHQKAMLLASKTIKEAREK